MTDFSHTLLLTDLDFTFFARGSRMVERNLCAIERFKKQGGYFSAATGRGKQKVLEGIPEAKELFNAPVVMCNGAWLYDFLTDETVGGEFLDPALTVEFVRFAESVLPPDAGVRVSTVDGYLTNAERIVPAVQRDMENRNLKAEFLPLDEWSPVGNAWIKMVIRGNASSIDHARPLIEREFAGKFEFSSSSDTYFEVQKKGCNKGTGLQSLAGFLQKRMGHPFRTAAIGDYENDIPMLTAADLSGCPANAMEPVRHIARLTLSDCDDGAVADLIEYMETSWPEE